MKRPIRIEGSIAYVPLTKGYTAIIDAADVRLVEGWNWYAQVNRRTVYAALTAPCGIGKRQMIRLHRCILDAPDDMHVDHVNGDGLDNRRANLRLATNAENQRNRGAYANNTSGIKGVHWHGGAGKWHARIMHEGSRVHLGYHATIEDAAAAYAKASAELHGVFGRVA